MSLLFWSSVIMSIICAIIAILLKKPWLMIIASVFHLPLSLYISATPLFRWWGLLFPILFIIAALFLRKNNRLLAIILIMPNIVLISWMGIMVLNQ